MKYRKAVFIVVYAKIKDKIEYLILKRKLHWVGWEFPKGKIEDRENKTKAAKRETKEETGLRVIKLKKFNISGKYLYQKKLPDRPDYIGQTFTLFAGQVKKSRVRLDPREHSNHKWVSFNKALKMLTWQDQRKCLRKVNEYLQEQKE